MTMLDAGCPPRNDRGIIAAGSRLKAGGVGGAEEGRGGSLSPGAGHKSHSFQPGCEEHFGAWEWLYPPQVRVRISQVFLE